MKPFVTAIVVSHDAADFLDQTLAALASQTVVPDRIFVVDSSSQKPTVAENIALISVPRKSDLPSSIAAALEAAPSQAGEWLWLLHDDSAPMPDCLEQLLLAAEKSPSARQLGPKQLDWHNPRIIAQQGLTLTRTGRLFSLVRGELDQAQHDQVDDVLAVGTAGTLILRESYKELGGLDERAPALAQDLDFSIRLRRAGNRVIVVPDAKIRHATLSLNQKRERRWLAGSPKTASRRAEIHLQLVHQPILTALLVWLSLPFIGLFRAIARVFNKTPNLLWGELSAAIWGFFSLPLRLSARRKNAGIALKRMRGLRASEQQVRSSRKAQSEFFEEQLTIEKFENGELAEQKSFLASGAGWLTLGILVASWQFFPAAVAINGAAVRPLAANWFNLFDSAGASFQNLGFGLWAPSDPFNWVLLAIGSLTFWQPSIALVVLVFLTKALAFISAWFWLSLWLNKAWQKNLAALVYALFPALGVAVAEGRIPVLLVWILLPVFLLGLAKITGWRAEPITVARTYTWVAISGLSLAAIAAANFAIGLVLLAAVAVLALVKIRKFGFLIWVPLPLAAIFSPTVIFYLFGLANPVALLADPSTPLVASESAWGNQLLFGAEVGPDFGFGAIGNFASIAILLIAAVALFARNTAATVLAASMSLGAVGLIWLARQIRVPVVGTDSQSMFDQEITNSTLPATAVLALAVALLVGVAMQSSKKVALSSATVSLAILPILATSILLVPKFAFGSDQVSPALVLAESNSGSNLKMLVVSPTQTESAVQYAAALVDGDGVQLEELSLVYRMALTTPTLGLAADDPRWLEIAAQRELHANLVANLVSANNSDLADILRSGQIGYVLVPDQDTELARNLGVSLDSIKELESVGETPFGWLWRVRDPNPVLLAGSEPQSRWSLTKAGQLGILAGFILLALPAGRSGARRERDSQIFVEGVEE